MQHFVVLQSRHWTLMTSARKGTDYTSNRNVRCSPLPMCNLSLFPPLISKCLKVAVPSISSFAGIMIEDYIGYPVTSVGLSFDGQCLLVASQDSVVRLFDHANGELLNKYIGHVNKDFRWDAVLKQSWVFLYPCTDGCHTRQEGGFKHYAIVIGGLNTQQWYIWVTPMFHEWSAARASVVIPAPQH